MDQNRSYNLLLLFLILILLSQSGSTHGWFFSSNQNSHHHSNHMNNQNNKNMASPDFSIESLNDPKGLILIENAQRKMLASDSCWQIAYQNVFEGCSKTLPDEESRSRLAWHLSDCFQQHTSRQSFPKCEPKSRMKNCLKKLDGDARMVYLEYFLETNSICHQLQTEAFKHQTERLVNDLKSTAEYAEVKLDKIEEQADLLLQNSKQVHDSLGTLDHRTQQVAQTSKMVEGHINSVLKYSEAIHEQSKGLAASQVRLSEGQMVMKEKLVEGIVLITNSYDSLGLQIMGLRSETVEVEKKIGEVGDAMFSKMTTLQSKADDIGSMAETSLDKQKQLLDGQSVALEGLDFLTKFQSRALEESRITLQELAEYGHKQQEELLEKQKQLHQSHDHLVESSKLILAAQEAFESKQTSMFTAIDKLFALHSAMLFESRVLITLFLYTIATFIIYMLTSTKHAYNVRHRFYLGLCLAFLVETSILWYVTSDAEKQGRCINVVRALFGLAASAQYLYAIFTYRDYELLNYNMLQTLIEKVNSMQGKNNDIMCYDSDVDDSEIHWSSWVDDDKELAEEVKLLQDPDYMLPEQVAENSSVSSSCTKRYNLRMRS